MNINKSNLQIKKAEYIFNQNHPALILTIDGKEALIADFKKPILDRGFVPLGSRDVEVEWRNILPEVTLPADNNNETEITLRGFTNDPVIIKLARDFYDAINHLNGKTFTIGEIAIPK